MSLGTAGWLGRSFESRPNEKKDCGGGGGFFKIDFPGVGIVTADDDGDGEEDISASSRAQFPAQRGKQLGPMGARGKVACVAA